VRDSNAGTCAQSAASGASAHPTRSHLSGLVSREKRTTRDIVRNVTAASLIRVTRIAGFKLSVDCSTRHLGLLPIDLVDTQSSVSASSIPFRATRAFKASILSIAAHRSRWMPEGVTDGGAAPGGLRVFGDIDWARAFFKALDEPKLSPLSVRTTNVRKRR
jgi:hypothetical protein